MAQPKKDPKGADLSGLDNFSLSSLMSGGAKDQDTTAEASAGAVSYAPLDHFHEDEDNARQVFNINNLQELADSMMEVSPTTGKKRGVLEPLSVKHHPTIPGHFIINGGARRYRAAKMASLEELPYIIKDELDDFDKFVLNDQREQLNPLEIATFIKARLEEGYKAGKIAKALGRPASYVSDHVIFFDMADSIRDLYDSGFCRSMQALVLLHRTHKKHPAEVDEFCQAAIKDRQELTTSRVRAFADALKKPAPKTPPEEEQPASPTGNDPEQEPQTADGTEEDLEPSPEGESPAPQEPASESPTAPKPDEDQHPLTVDGEPLSGGVQPDPAGEILEDDAKGDRIKKAIIQVKHDDREARLLTDRRAAYGLAWIKYDDDGYELEVDLNQVSLVAVIEA